MGCVVWKGEPRRQVTLELRPKDEIEGAREWYSRQKKTASSQGFDGEEAWCLACSERMEDVLLAGAQ